MSLWSTSRAGRVVALVGISGVLAWVLFTALRTDDAIQIDRSGAVGVGVRATEVRERNDASYDDAYETCLAAGISSLAHRLQIIHATPRTVARAFAAGWDPAFRSGPYRGCLAALRTS